MSLEIVAVFTYGLLHLISELVFSVFPLVFPARNNTVSLQVNEETDQDQKVSHRDQGLYINPMKTAVERCGKLDPALCLTQLLFPYYCPLIPGVTSFPSLE